MLGVGRQHRKARSRWLRGWGRRPAQTHMPPRVLFWSHGCDVALHAFTDVCAIRNAPVPPSLLRHTRVSTPGGSQTTCCPRAGVQCQFLEKTMVGDTRRGGEQGTNAHECTCISTSLARQARMLAPPIPPDRSLRTHTREKEKNGGCIVPNGTDRHDATDSSKSGAKEGVDGRHPGPNASRMRPREGTLQPRLAPEAGGWVAGPMQPNHRARGRRR